MTTSPSSPSAASCSSTAEPELAGPHAGSPLRVGVLASQGGFARHARMLEELGADAREVRNPGELADLDALVIPGGESTTIAKAIERDGLEAPIRSHVDNGGAVLGTCAGMILLGREHLGLLDASTRRNAWGRQLASFEADVRIPGIGDEPIRAVFIRAPWVEDAGADVEVLAEVDGHPVVVRQGRIIACSFHPELTDDSRMHALLMAIASTAQDRRPV